MSFPRKDGVPVIPKGTGTATAVPSGVLVVNVTQAGTAGDTAETDLWTYSLPANTLSANGKGVRVRAWGTVGANGNTKSIRPYFGGTSLRLLSTTSNAGAWVCEWEIYRTGASAQKGVVVNAITGTALGISAVSPAADTTAAIIIKLTGQNDAAAAANDIVLEGARVEALN